MRLVSRDEPVLCSDSQVGHVPDVEGRTTSVLLLPTIIIGDMMVSQTAYRSTGGTVTLGNSGPARSSPQGSIRHEIYRVIKCRRSTQTDL